MFTLKTKKIIDRQVRQISFLSLFFHDVEYVHGKDNVVRNALSRLEIVKTTELPTLRQWALDPQLQRIIANNSTTSLRLQPRDTPDGMLYSDFSTGNACLYVPSTHRRRVFNALHGQAHSGRRPIHYASSKRAMLFEKSGDWP